MPDAEARGERDARTPEGVGRATEPLARALALRALDADAAAPVAVATRDADATTLRDGRFDPLPASERDTDSDARAEPVRGDALGRRDAVAAPLIEGVRESRGLAEPLMEEDSFAVGVAAADGERDRVGERDAPLPLG